MESFDARPKVEERGGKYEEMEYLVRGANQIKRFLEVGFWNFSCINEASDEVKNYTHEPGHSLPVGNELVVC